MSLLSNVIGFSVFGFATRCLQLGIQQKHMFHAPQTHLMAMAGFGVVGWGVFELEGRQQIMIDQRRTMLLEARRKENEEYERKKASGGEEH